MLGCVGIESRFSLWVFDTDADSDPDTDAWGQGLLDGFIVRRGLVGSAALSDGNSVLLRLSVILAAILLDLGREGLTRRTDPLRKGCFAAMNWRSTAGRQSSKHAPGKGTRLTAQWHGLTTMSAG